MRFQYLEIRPCVEVDGATMNFLGKSVSCKSRGTEIHTPENAMAEAMAYLDRHGGKFFWTLYGRDGEGFATAIGDFATFEGAKEIMNAILAPMTAARDLIHDHPLNADRAADDLDDFINQCSTEERL